MFEFFKYFKEVKLVKNLVIVSSKNLYLLPKKIDYLFNAFYFYRSMQRVTLLKTDFSYFV